MVKEFLKKMRAELLDEKMKLESEQKVARIKADQNGRFLEKLKEEEDQSSDLFSPRKKNMKLQESILEFEQEQGTLTQISSDLNENLQSLNLRLAEIDSVLNEIKEWERENEKEKPFMELHDYLNKNMKGILGKTELCSKMLPADPVRCKLELSSVIKSLQDIRKMLPDVLAEEVRDAGD